MSKLKLCPFCGNNKLQTTIHFTEDGYYCAVICSECSLEMLSDGWSDPQSAEAEVMAKWNKRVGVNND